MQKQICQTTAEDNTNTNIQFFVKIHHLYHLYIVISFLLCIEDGGVFSAPREGDGEEPQDDVHLSCTGCQLLCLERKDDTTQ